MAITLKVIEIGDSEGIILPDEILARLQVKEGDTLCLSDLPNGILLAPCRDRVTQERAASVDENVERGGIAPESDRDR